MILVPLTIYIVEKSKNQDLLSHIVKSEKVFLCWFIWDLDMVVHVQVEYLHLLA